MRDRHWMNTRASERACEWTNEGTDERAVEWERERVNEKGRMCEGRKGGIVK